MNKLILDQADNAELKTALQGKQPGDRATLKIEVMVTDNGDERFEGDIESISIEGNDDSGSSGDGKDIVPDATTPIMIVMTAKSDKSGKDYSKDEAKKDAKSNS